MCSLSKQQGFPCAHSCWALLTGTLFSKVLRNILTTVGLVIAMLWHLYIIGAHSEQLMWCFCQSLNVCHDGADSAEEHAGEAALHRLSAV